MISAYLKKVEYQPTLGVKRHLREDRIGLPHQLAPRTPHAPQVKASQIGLEARHDD